MNMKTPTRILLVLAALGLTGTVAMAQDTPAPPAAPPAVERPVQVERPATPDTPPAPTVEAPDVEAANADAPASDADEPRIVWDRDRGRDWRRRGRGERQDEIVTIGGSSTLERGRRAEAVVSVFGSSTSYGEVREAVVSVFGNTRIEDGEVREAAVAVLGNNYVNAPVGEVVAVMGNVELGPKAVVNGNIVVVGGTLQRDPAAIVRGGVQHIMGLPAGMMEPLQAWVRNCLAYLRPLGFGDNLGWAWAIALGFLLLYALIGGLFREPVDRCVKTLREQPGQTLLASLLTVVLAPVLFTILAITIIGVAFIPIVGFGMVLATLFGKAVVLAWIGRSLLRTFDEEDKLNPALAVLLGGAIVLLLYVVPVLGFVVYNLFGILALGVVVYTLLLSARARRRNSQPPGGLGPKPSMTPGDAGTPGGGAAAGAGAGMASAGEAAGTSSAYGKSPGAAFAADNPAPEGGGSSGFTSGPDPAFAGAAAAFADSSSGDSSGSGGFGGGAAGGPGGAGFSSGGGAGGGGSGGGFGPAYAGGPSPRISPIDALNAPRAGFWIRMLALAIDAVIIGVAFHLLDSERLQLVALAAYGAIMWKLKGTTVGGIVCNLRVVRLDGREIDWSTSIVRALGCFLSLIILGLGFIWIAFDEGKQSWHDKLAGTAVVRVPQGVSLL
jgi:uncharacterized RDD family membrane protein YckC